MVFNHRFRVEAKDFAVSINDSGIVKLTGWGSKFSYSIFMGRYGSIWIVNMVDRLRRSEFEDCVFKFNESSIVFLAQRCVNR